MDSERSQNLIINKPTFNTDVLKEGKAIHVETYSKNGFKCFDEDCIITSRTPLSLEVYYYSESEGYMEDMNIPIEDVVAGVMRIALLKEIQ